MSAKSETSRWTKGYEAGLVEGQRRARAETAEQARKRHVYLSFPLPRGHGDVVVTGPTVMTRDDWEFAGGIIRLAWPLEQPKGASRQILAEAISGGAQVTADIAGDTGG